MKESEQNQKEQGRIDLQAAEWVVKHDEGLTAAEQDSFFQWLAEDPRHGVAYAEHRQAWQESDLLAEWRPEHSEEPNPDLLATRPIRGKLLKLWGGVGAALAACIAIALFLDLGGSDRSGVNRGLDNAHFIAAAYEYRVLSDGTELDLNAGSEIRVAYTEGRRLVELLSGEVYFKVAKNPRRPFVVRVDGTEVRALGTAFNVKFQPNELEVVVTEGRVRWQRSLDDSAKSKEPGEEVSFQNELVSGQRSFISLDEPKAMPLVEAIAEEQIDSILTWRHELLDFESTRLIEAVEEFNRRNRVQLVIADPELNDKTIVATVRSDNVERFVLLLDLALGVEVDRGTPDEIILRMKDKT